MIETILAVSVIIILCLQVRCLYCQLERERILRARTRKLIKFYKDMPLSRGIRICDKCRDVFPATEIKNVGVWNVCEHCE